MIRLWLARLGEMIDSETVRLYRAVMYTLLCWAAIYMTLWGHAPTTVEAAMGGPFDHVWKALMFFGPVLVFLGSLLVRFHEKLWGSAKYIGLWMQFSADIGVTCALIAYCIAVLQSPWWGNGTFALWPIIGLSICTAVVAVRDARQLRAVEQVTKIIIKEQ